MSIENLSQIFENFFCSFMMMLITRSVITFWKLKIYPRYVCKKCSPDSGLSESGYQVSGNPSNKKVVTTQIQTYLKIDHFFTVFDQNVSLATFFEALNNISCCSKSCFTNPHHLKHFFWSYKIFIFSLFFERKWPKKRFLRSGIDLTVFPVEFQNRNQSHLKNQFFWWFWTEKQGFFLKFWNFFVWTGFHHEILRRKQWDQSRFSKIAF